VSAVLFPTALCCFLQIERKRGFREDQKLCPKK
jgi:hypothetical protein